MTPTIRPRTGLQLIGLGIVLGTFTIADGGRGLALGGLTALAWWLLPPMFAFVVGHVALVLVVPSTGGLGVLAAAEIGLIGLLCTATVGPPRPGRVLALAGCAVGTATGFAWLGLDRVATVWGVGGVVLGGGALLAYWLHRYERVALELPADPSPNDE